MRFNIGRCLLRERLKENRMSQQELADLVSIHKSSISEYASGKAKMELKTAKTIANALKCHIDDLYEWIPLD
jgi:DNA-binding XRE family transcriptional regulator